jgi:PiT family inorganic phosphate transporter
MAWAFVTYITLKGLKEIWAQILQIINFLPFVSLEIVKKPSSATAMIMGLVVAFFVYFLVKNKLNATNSSLENNKKSLNRLFTIPLIFSAALLSFAHGANDVANAIGPLAAINDAIVHGGVSTKASIPFWIMAVGGFGIAVGLALYGPKLIKTVGSEITKLDQIRAFSIAMAASVTVIIASQLGLPVSSTHIAIGGVFGVGFLREWLDVREIENTVSDDKLVIVDEKKNLNAYMAALKAAEAKEDKVKEDYERIVELYKLIAEEEELIKSTKKHMKKTKKVEYVKRDAVKKIIAAWLITVPAAAILSALLYFMIKGIMI